MDKFSYKKRFCRIESNNNIEMVTSELEEIKNSQSSDDNSSEYQSTSESESLTITSESEKEQENIENLSLSFKNLRAIDNIKKWSVSKDQIKKFFNFKINDVKKDWCNIVFDSFIVKHNPYCVLVFKYKHVKVENSRKRKMPFFRATARCKHSSCKTNHTFTMRKL